MKRGILFTLFLIGIIGLSSNAFALLQCWDNQPGGNPLGYAGGTEIIKLSSRTNGHAEYPTSLYAGGTYPVSIYCKESTGIALTVSGASTNAFVNLSAQTNAHAQLATQSGYTSILSLTPASGTLTFSTNFPAGAPCPAGSVDILHLSDVTNAHVESPFSGPGNYGTFVCASFSGSGGGGGSPYTGDVVSASNTGGFVNTLAANAAMNLTYLTSKTGATPPTSVVRTVTIATVCDRDDPTPSGATTYGALCSASNPGVFFARYRTDNMAAPNIFKNRFGKEYDTTARPYSTIYNPGILAANLLTDQGTLDAASGTWNYTIDAGALGLIVGHNYRIHMFSLPSEFDDSGPPTPDSIEAAPVLANNYQYLDFVVTPPTSGGPSGLGGDVYLLKDIQFPNLYTNQDIVMNLSIEDKHTDWGAPHDSTNPATVTVTIRDAQGEFVSIYQNLPIPGGATFPGASSDETISLPFTVQSATAPGVFRVGETYTAYVTVQPYRDTGSPDWSETITTNNAGFKTFTVLDTPNSLSVPDAPWWMAIAFMGVIVGWLFVTSRTEKKE